MAGESERPPVTVTLPAEIDAANSAAVGKSLLDAIDKPGVVIADMTGTTFCDSSGVRMLVSLWDRAEASGSTLRIVITPGGSLERILGILGLHRVLPIYTSVQDAMAVSGT